MLLVTETWLQNPNDQTAEDFTNIRHDTCRTLKRKKRNYMKVKVNTHEENSKTVNGEIYKGINEFKKGYQPHAYIIKKHDGTIVADTSNILNKC